MRRNQHRWSGALVRRGLFAVVTIFAIAAYGLVTGGSQSLSFKPAASYNYGAASQPSVGEAISPANSSVNVAVRGPNNSLMFYWQVGGTWYGPLGLGGANTTYSAPVIVAQASSGPGTPGYGNFNIAVEGPNHTLYFYWDASGTWYGPLAVGPAGSTYSTPSMIEDNLGNLVVAAQGPTNSLYAYWNTTGAWYGPLAIGGYNSAFSAPKVSRANCCQSSDYVYVFAAGPNNDMRQWESDVSHPWNGPQEWSNDGTTFSSPTGYDQYTAFEGPNHALWWSEGFYQYIQIATAGNVYSAPSLTSGGTQNIRITAQGPSHSLYFWYGSDTSGQGFHGPSQVNGAGTTYSAPSMAEDPVNSNNLDLAVQGPNNTLWFYWNLGGPWYGPLQVAGAGTTFGSAN